MGKVVLTQPERIVPMLEGLVVHRMGEKEFAEAATTPIPRARGAGARGRGGDPEENEEAGNGRGLAARAARFYKAEGVIATFNCGSENVMASVGSDLSAQQQRTDSSTIFQPAIDTEAWLPARECQP